MGGEEISTQENLKKGDDMGTGDCGFGFDSAESQAIRSIILVFSWSGCGFVFPLQMENLLLVFHLCVLI